MILQHERGLKAEGEIKIIQNNIQKRLQRIGPKIGKGYKIAFTDKTGTARKDLKVPLEICTQWVNSK